MLTFGLITRHLLTLGAVSFWASHASVGDAYSQDRDEIIVVGEHLPKIEGEWSFLQTGTYRSDYSDRDLPDVRWTMCIKDKDSVRAIDAIIGYNARFSRLGLPSECRRWHATIKDGILSGKKGCFIGKSRITGDMKGTATTNKIDIILLHGSAGIEARARGSTNITGTKVGECK